MVIKNRVCVWAGIFGLIIASCSQAAYRGEMETKETDPKITELANVINSKLDGLLTSVSEGKQPVQKDLSTAQVLVDESKRYFLQMDDKQKAQYCLLQSWVSYYNNQLESAHLNAVKACRLDATSGDAWATQVTMAILSGKKPLLPRPPRQPRLQRNRQGQGGMEMPAAAESTATIQKGKLDFEVSQFQGEAIDKPIKTLAAVDVQGKPFEYQSGDTVLCALLWRKFEVEKPAAGKDKPDAGIDQFLGTIQQEQSEDNSSETAFEKLYKMGQDSSKVKYIGVNLDTAEHKDEVLGEMNGRSRPWAEVLTAGQDGKLFAGLEMTLRAVTPSRSILIMTDPNGTVRYAGPTDGIVPKIVLSKFASVEMIIEQEQTPQLIDNYPVFPGEPNRLPPRPADGNTVSDGNAVTEAVRPAPPVEIAQQPVKPKVQPKELSEEDQIQAEKKLGAARDLFMKLGRKPGLNYRRGVELCREVMRDWPGSEYASQAQLLLREVPERERGQYGITDQELGL